MTPEPVLALSIRQPWAWLIVNGFKNIENRDWRTNQRGPVFVHASQARDQQEWDEAIQFICEVTDTGDERRLRALIGIPTFEAIERGGIVGRVNITDCVPESESPWFVGDFGFVLADARPLPFRACRGTLKFFKPALSAPAVGELLRVG